jgi:GINS complex subunit 2
VLSTTKGKTAPLQPPRRGILPLWLALLLKRQRRVNILPPPWLHPESLSEILKLETDHDLFPDAFSPSAQLVSNHPKDNRGAPLTLRTLDGTKHIISPPFLPQNTAGDTGNFDTAQTPALPYHWLEIATMLLDSASDDLVEPDSIRRILRDLREVRMAKMRRRVEHLDATTVGGASGVALIGIGAMEVAEGRGFMSGVAEVLR